MWISDAAHKELQTRGVDLLSPAGYGGMYVWVGESISAHKREMTIYSTGVAICEQPLSNYYSHGPDHYAAFGFSSEEELFSKLDEIGWTAIPYKSSEVSEEGAFNEAFNELLSS